MNNETFIAAVTNELLKLGYSTNEFESLLDPQTGIGRFESGKWTNNPNANFDPALFELVTLMDDTIFSVCIENNLNWNGFDVATHQFIHSVK